MLRDREKAVLIIGGIAAALILLLTFVVFPDVSKVKALSRQHAQAGKDLAELRQMKPELERADREVKQKTGRMSVAAGGAESPLSRLTAALVEAGLPSSAFSLKSTGVKDGEFQREESFEVRIENMTYLEAVRISSRLETGPLPVVIRSAQMKSRYDDAKYLDTTLRIGYLLPPAK
ncbi:MAG TPA: hypothetical protein VIV15_02740 [Anaerolineales bacterium]